MGEAWERSLVHIVFQRAVGCGVRAARSKHKAPLCSQPAQFFSGCPTSRLFANKAPCGRSSLQVCGGRVPGRRLPHQAHVLRPRAARLPHPARPGERVHAGRGVGCAGTASAAAWLCSSACSLEMAPDPVASSWMRTADSMRCVSPQPTHRRTSSLPWASERPPAEGCRQPAQPAVGRQPTRMCSMPATVVAASQPAALLQDTLAAAAACCWPLTCWACGACGSRDLMPVPLASAAPQRGRVLMVWGCAPPDAQLPPPCRNVDPPRQAMPRMLAKLEPAHADADADTHTHTSSAHRPPMPPGAAVPQRRNTAPSCNLSFGHSQPLMCSHPTLRQQQGTRSVIGSWADSGGRRYAWVGAMQVQGMIKQEGQAGVEFRSGLCWAGRGSEWQGRARGK